MERNLKTYRVDTATGLLVSDYVMKFTHHSLIATKVTFPDGREIRFVERLSKTRAIHSALYQAKRGYFERVK